MEQEIWDTVKNLDENDLVPAAGPTQKPEAVPSSATILSIVDKIRYSEMNGGFLGIAQAHSVSMGTVKLIHAAMRRRLADIADVTP
jgi:hypothetical protein